VSLPTDLRLPGITFEAVPPELPDTLPRMDVAAFVGFASAGPLHVPVVVEDVARFRDIFGPAAPLARDPGSGQTRYAHLGPSVEDFFANGGRRCWVVRVADEATAGRGGFPLAGLVGVDRATGRWRLASARARAVGSWADQLAVAPVLGSVPLPAVTGVDNPGRRLILAAGAPLVAGDLLRLTFDGGRILALVMVASTRRVGAGLEVGWDRVWLLRSPSTAAAPPAPVRAARVTVAGEAALAEPPQLDPTDVPGQLTLTFGGDDVPGPGDLLRLDLEDGSVMVAPVAGPSAPAGPAAPASIPADGPRSVATGATWVIQEAPADDLTGAGPRLPVAERLDLSVTVWSGERLDARLDGLGFDPRHPRYWGALPTDEQLYGALAGLPGDERRSAPPPLWALAASPRLALAGPEGGAAGQPRGVAWLPLALADTAAASSARGPVTDTAAGTRLARDGLEVFRAGLFLDPDLADQGAGTLLERAFAKSSVMVPAQPLQGVHALLPVDEVTLVAVPDAGHPGWHEVVEKRPDVPTPPYLWPPVDDRGPVTLWWTPVAGAAGYVVERGGRPDLDPAAVLLDGPAPLGPAAPPPGPGPAAGAAVGMALALDDCPALLWLRVRASFADGPPGPWSNTVTAVLPPADFEGCATPLPAPVVALDPGPPGPAGGGWLVWEARPGLEAEVEHGGDPGFGTVDERHLVRWGRRDHVAAPEHAASFHRVRYRTPGGGAFGPWSNTVVLPAPARRSVQADEPARGELDRELLSVHRAVLRMAGARGDLLAVLSLAAHYRQPETIEHLSALTGLEPRPGGPAAPTGPGLVRMLDRGEAHVLSHGAVYHPWTVVRTVSGVRPTPPDGAVSGIIARRSIARGAWVSPGNQLLGSVVALTPTLEVGAVGGLRAAGVNVVARRPAGFVPLDADTLSADDSLAPIGVRRLLILLRRLALRHGTTYVFEPHDERFRSMVRRTFETLLGQLYQRGAFAGAVPSEAFRVVADDSVNPGSLADAGRFVVELRVAPAQPLQFLRVRLVQSGSGDLTVAEV
jgi:hypothetical protein